MKLERLKGNECHRGRAYYVITCKTSKQAEAIQELLEDYGWYFINDSLEDNELGIFVNSGIYGDEKDFKHDYKLSKKQIREH